MNKSDKEALMGLGSLLLLGWLLNKDKYKCPRCNYPVNKNQFQCPNCGQPFGWEGF